MSTPRLTCLLCGVLLLPGCIATTRDLQIDSRISAMTEEQALQWMRDELATHPRDMALRARYLQALNTHSLRLLALAKNAHERGDSDLARSYLQQLLVIAPGSDDALSLLRWLDRQDEAKAKLEQAMPLLVSQPVEGKRLLDEALALQPENLQAQQLRDALGKMQPPDVSPQLSARMDEHISVQFQDQPLVSIFDLVSRITGLSFAFDTDVEQGKPTTIYANDTSVRNVLQMVMRANLLESQAIGPSAVMIFPSRPDKGAQHRTLEMRVFRLNYATAPQALAMLKQMVKTPDIYMDERINTIIMRDRPDAIAVAERLIDALDVPQAEVMLDVQVLEVTSTDFLDLGIGYPASIGASPLSSDLPDQPAGSVTLNDLRQINSRNVLVNLGTPSITLDMLQRSGKVRALANPRIRVRNGEKGHVLIGDRIPVVTTTLSDSFSTENVTYQDVGLSLTVEPVISNDDEVQVKLQLEASNIAETIETQSGLVVYRIGTRTADTLMTVRNNQTQALGGLMQRSDNSANAGLPGLSRIPILGRLFGTLLNDRRQSELVLLLTPHIVRQPPPLTNQQRRFSSGTEQLIGLDNGTLVGGGLTVQDPNMLGGPPPLLPPAPTPAPMPAPTIVPLPPPPSTTIDPIPVTPPPQDTDEAIPETQP